jgi:hypothetical protein
MKSVDKLFVINNWPEYLYKTGVSVQDQYNFSTGKNVMDQLVIAICTEVQKFKGI